MNLSFHHLQSNTLITWQRLVNPTSKVFRVLAWFVILLWALAVTLIILSCHSSRSLELTETRGQSISISGQGWDSLWITPNLFKNYNAPSNILDDSTPDNPQPFVLTAVRHYGQQVGGQLADTSSAVKHIQKETAIHSGLDLRFLVFLAAAAAILFALLIAFLVLLRRL